MLGVYNVGKTLRMKKLIHPILVRHETGTDKYPTLYYLWKTHLIDQ
jgi:hypothetical protein